jgi:hypothetical protein
MDSLEPNDEDVSSTSLAVEATDKITDGYNNWAVCVDYLNVRNGPGISFPISTVKPLCKPGENAYVMGTARATNGRLVGKLPGWGTYEMGGRKFGFSDARWLARGKMYTSGEFAARHIRISTPELEKERFIFKSKEAADNAVCYLNNVLDITQAMEEEGRSDNEIGNIIMDVLGEVPVVGSFCKFLEPRFTVHTWVGEWTVEREGPFYAVKHWS